MPGKSWPIHDLQSKTDRKQQFIRHLMRTGSRFRAARLICISLSIAASSFAATGPESKPLNLATSFSTEIDRLPANFLGHDAKALYEALARLKIPEKKSDFESDADFRRRADESVGRMLPTIYAISYSVDDPRFDFEKQKFEVWLDLDPVYFLNNEKRVYRLNLLPFASRKVGSYIGSNAYNVKAIVSEFEEGVIGLGMHFKEPAEPRGPFTVALAGNRVAGYFKMNVEMNTERAKAAKPQLAVLFVGTLRAPYLYKSLDEQLPTISMPRHTTYVYRTVIMDPVAVMVFNRKSGEIYKSIFAKYGWQEKSSEIPDAIKPLSLPTINPGKESEVLRIAGDSTNSLDSRKMEVCENFSRITKAFIKMRTSGKSKQEALGAAEDNAGQNDMLRLFASHAIEVVYSAYSEQNAINSTYNKCILNIEELAIQKNQGKRAFSLPH